MARLTIGIRDMLSLEGMVVSGCYLVRLSLGLSELAKDKMPEWAIKTFWLQWTRHRL